MRTLRALALVLACGLLPVLAPAATRPPPNIVLIVADDHGTDAIGAYGNKRIQTPNLDSLARDGISFTSAFATTASCSPSRSVLLTGLHNHANGMYGLEHEQHHFSSLDSIQSLPVMLAKGGYRTARVGKYHIGPERVYHFDVALSEGKANDMSSVARSPVEMAELARPFITNGDRPFFLYYATDDPHRGSPFATGDAPNGFGNRAGGYPGIKEVTYRPEDVIVPAFLPDTTATRQELAQYYQAVSRLDQGVGRLIQILKAAGKYDDTVVIYLSDNGIAFPGAKTTAYDAGLRLPLIVRAPGQRSSGVSSDAMISWVDVTPTLLDYAGVRSDVAFHGRSFKAVVENPQAAGRDEVYASHSLHEIYMYYPMRAVRTRQYKLIYNIAHELPWPFAQDLYQSLTWQAFLKSKASTYGGRKLEAFMHRPQLELYDVAADPLETRNLADDPPHAGVRVELMRKIQEFQQRTVDPWLLDPDKRLDIPPPVAVSPRARNVIFILTDDQRYDEVGILDPTLRTPNLDRLAKGGVRFANAFVTTALCSPSRASILSGRYMHDHGVVDNNSPLRKGTVLFPEYLQRAGYTSAFIGKWHMGGDGDEPQPGFDRWVSFAGQGNYYPTDVKGESVNNAAGNVLNVDGRHVPQRGYITDELTDYALEWLQSGRDKTKPFFLYLSHKALHADFRPAQRHEQLYADARIDVPASMADTAANYAGKPMWVKNQRNSWHGVDFPYHSKLDIREYRRAYHRTLAAVDDSVGRILDELRESGLESSTVVIFTSDNGFMFGEHGLIDKRNAYEESMRVPLLAYAPGLFPAGVTVSQMVANLDFAPTILELGGMTEMPVQFAGHSWLTLAEGRTAPDWRRELLYEYYWEFNYPMTPTTFAVRTDRYKLIQYHGVWDTDELYDVQGDPREMHNLIDDPARLATKIELRRKLYDLLAGADGQHAVPYTRKFNRGATFRRDSGARAAEFPEQWLRRPGAADLDQHFIPDAPDKAEKLQRQQKY